MYIYKYFSYVEGKQISEAYHAACHNIYVFITLCVNDIWRNKHVFITLYVCWVSASSIPLQDDFSLAIWRHDEKFRITCPLLWESTSPRCTPLEGM